MTGVTVTAMDSSESISMDSSESISESRSASELRDRCWQSRHVTRALSATGSACGGSGGSGAGSGPGHVAATAVNLTCHSQRPALQFILISLAVRFGSTCLTPCRTVLIHRVVYSNNYDIVLQPKLKLFLAMDSFPCKGE
jgi:hypothetical protein